MEKIPHALRPPALRRNDLQAIAAKGQNSENPIVCDRTGGVPIRIALGPGNHRLDPEDFVPEAAVMGANVADNDSGGLVYFMPPPEKKKFAER